MMARVERVPGDLRRCTWLILGDNGSLEVGESRISVHFRPQIRSASRRGRYVERRRVKTPSGGPLVRLDDDRALLVRARGGECE